MIHGSNVRDNHPLAQSILLMHAVPHLPIGGNMQRHMPYSLRTASLPSEGSPMPSRSPRDILSAWLMPICLIDQMALCCQIWRGGDTVCSRVALLPPESWSLRGVAQ